MTTFKQYDQNVDYQFFAAHQVKVTQLMPWQFRLEHPDITGRFVWYPTSGALIYEQSEWGVAKVGEYKSSEEVYEKIMEKTI